MLINLLAISSLVPLTLAHRTCGARDINENSDLHFETGFEQLQQALRVNTRSDYLKFPVEVPVYFHIVHMDGEGNVDESVLDKQIKVLNADYADTGLFKFKKVGTTRTESGRWWARTEAVSLEPYSEKQYQMKSALRQGGSDTLNIYISNLSEGLLGYATFPIDYSATPLDDGVVINYKALPDGEYTGYNLGRTLTHEVGHWAGLYHTFTGSCSWPNDYISDTIPQKWPSSGCPKPSTTCSAEDFQRSDKFSWSLVQTQTDSSSNFMDYSDDACMNHFSAGQINRMKLLWQYLRNTKIVDKKNGLSNTAKPKPVYFYE